MITTTKEIINAVSADHDDPINLEETNRFLDLLCGGDAVTFQTFDDNANDSSLTRLLHGRLEQRSEELTSLNQQGAGIFVCVNQTDGTGRKAGNITKVRAVFVDLDEAPLQPVLEAELEPSFVVETSSDRYHAYWFVDDLPLDLFTRVQKALIEQFNGDPAVQDLSRVMRLPGFHNCKREPFLVSTIANSEQRYSASEILPTFSLITEQVGDDLERTSSQKVQEGHRNTHLTSLAGTLRRAGLEADVIAATLNQENEGRCEPPSIGKKLTVLHKASRDIHRKRSKRQLRPTTPRA